MAPTAAASAVGRAIATDAVPSSARVAAPAARRRVSLSYAARPAGAAPRPVRTRTGAATAPLEGIRTTWSGLPLTPRPTSAPPRLVRRARGRSGAPRPPARLGPSGPATTPITRASALTSAGDLSLIRRVVTTAMLWQPWLGYVACHGRARCRPHVTSPLNARHVELGAKMADFGGWSMPIEYPGGGVVREHAAVRERVGIFDVSHLGKALVRGPGAADFVNATLSNDLGRIGAGQAQYTLCCDDESGGVVDDLIAYLRTPDEVFLVPNAANTAEVVRRLSAAAPPGVAVTDEHTAYGVIAVQGPRVRRGPGRGRAAHGLGLPALRRRRVAGSAGRASAGPATPASGATSCCRAGPTPRRSGTPCCRPPSVCDGLPCGLGRARHVAHRDGLPAARPRALAVDHPGHGPGRVGGRLGQGRLLGPRVAARRARGGPVWRRSAGLGPARHRSRRPARRVRGADSADGGEVGVTTSGTFSPTLKQGIALALLDRSVGEGDELIVDVRGRDLPVRVVKPPFVEVQTR